MSKITKEQFLRIQIRNAQYRLEIQNKQKQKIRELLKANVKATDIMKSFLEANKPHKVFGLLIDMNDTIHEQTEKMSDCDVISQTYFHCLHKTVQQLTSKDGKVGEPRTPEMNQFQMLMTSHSQMHSKSNEEHFRKYETNLDDKRPKH